jgi:hypothetical protein
MFSVDLDAVTPHNSNRSNDPALPTCCCRRLGERQAAPWSRKMSATSRAGCAKRTGASRRLLRVRSRWRQEPVERAGDRAQTLGGDVRVASRRVELGVPEQHLDHAHVGGALQQVRGEGVAQVRGETQVPSPAVSAAIWQTRLSWRAVSGLTGSCAGTSEPCERHCSTTP